MQSQSVPVSPAPGSTTLGPVDTKGDNLIRHLRRLAADRGLDIPAFAVPEERMIDAGMMRLACLDWGNASAPPVVFLHGGRLNAHSWDLVCLGLRDRYHCIAMDLPGHGDSDRPPDSDYSLDASAEYFHGFVNGLGLKQFFLVGLSQGGLQSIAFATRYADRLRGLVLMDVSPDLNLEGARRHSQRVAVYEPQDSFESFMAIVTGGATPRDPDRLRFILSQNVKQRPDGKWVWKYDIDHRSKLDVDKFNAANHKFMALLPNIACPTLVLRGESSEILLPFHAEQLAKGVANGKWVQVPDAGHIIHSDNPKAVIGLLRDFLGGLSGN